MDAVQAVIPREVLCAADYEVLAPQFLPGPIHAYIAGGSGQDLTVAFNRDAFARWAIFPRLLCDVTGGTTRLDLAGVTLPHPVLLAPVAFQTLADPRGELETARGAAATQTCMVASTLSTFTLEEISASCGPQRWFQLYFQPEGRAATLGLVRRTQQAGYTAIVVTLDAAVQAASLSSLRAGFTMPADCVAANLQAEVVDEAPPVQDGESRIFQGIMRAAATWPDLEWLLAQTTLAVWVKGVLHPDDAVRLKRLGVTGLVVSNHGGRSLDGAPASLDALPAIRAAVGEGYPLLLDSGIRSGSDVFKALALGANAVMVGRLQMYALAVAGALGVAHMLKLLREELEVCMALAGCARVEDITMQALTPVHPVGRTFVKDQAC
jgi:4-hydroxymandelate oxidase